VIATDWYAWHAPYDDLTSPLARRLEAVQEVLNGVLHGAPPGPLSAVSLAAGQSRDLIPLLIEHPRGRDVRARLVELDARNADFTEGAVLGAALDGVDVVVGDAGCFDVFAGAVPADLVLVCGLFEELTLPEIVATIQALPQLCAEGATVIWTSDRASADVRAWFEDAGFQPPAVPAEGADRGASTVGVHRWTGPAGRLRPAERVFRLG